MAAHPVDDDEQAPGDVHVDAVLVFRALQPRVARAGSRQGSGHRRIRNGRSRGYWIHTKAAASASSMDSRISRPYSSARHGATTRKVRKTTSASPILAPSCSGTSTPFSRLPPSVSS